MRRAISCALMISLLLLPGCGEREAKLEETFDSLRSAVTAAQHIAFQAELTADWGDTVTDYTLRADYDGQQTTVEVLAPELIAGVKATALRGETSVSFDGVELGAGPLDEEGLTPVSALPVMLDAMASAYVELLWREEDAVAARLYVGEQSVMTLWLDGWTGAPAAMEASTGGRTVVRCTISDWEIT